MMHTDNFNALDSIAGATLQFDLVVLILQLEYYGWILLSFAHFIIW